MTEKEAEIPPLRKRKCRKCLKPVLVSEHKANADQATGMVAKREKKTVGVLCFDCAEKAIDFCGWHGTRVQGSIHWTDSEPMEFHYQKQA